MSLQLNSIKTFVFLDLETTGLPQEEHNLTKITEMCLVAVQADHLELGVFPRVCNKLNFCFNPNKVINPYSTDITKLSNELLENQSKFSADFVSVINIFLSVNPKPICLVAHNGNRFDFPILRAEIANTGGFLDEDLYCVDSLEAFLSLEENRKEPTAKSDAVPFELNDGYDEILSKACDELEEKMKAQKSSQEINETTPKRPTSCFKYINSQTPPKKNLFTPKCVNSRVSYKLVDVFRRITKRSPTLQHQAEGDVIMMLTCAATYGDKFIEYTKKNARKFSDVPIMRPGTPIGK